MSFESFKYLIEGLLLGFAYAMPIGAQNIFVIHSAATQKSQKSYITALLVSLVDVSLSLACFYGVGVLVEKAPVIRVLLFLLGALFLFYYGYKLILSSDTLSLEQKPIDLTIWEIAKRALVLTWFNPQALLDGSLLFGSYRASLPHEMLFPFLIGVIIASPVWFFSVTTLVGGLKAAFSGKIFEGVNRVCGLILIVFAVKLLSTFIRGGGS